MDTSSSQLTRKPSILSNALNWRLSHYAIAASAAASLLALSPAANAEIVYTPADVTAGNGSSYNLDLNNDGTPEFVIEGFGLGLDIRRISTGIEGIEEIVPCSNISSTYCTYAAAVAQGNMIPGKISRFASEAAQIEFVRDNVYYGYWHNVKSHYLGLEFQVNGKIHYGWARMSVQVTGASVIAHITGYAYETVAKQPIHAGQRMETTEAPTSDAASGQGSLGALARGTVVGNKLPVK